MNATLYTLNVNKTVARSKPISAAIIVPSSKPYTKHLLYSNLF